MPGVGTNQCSSQPCFASKVKGSNASQCQLLGTTGGEAASIALEPCFQVSHEHLVGHSENGMLDSDEPVASSSAALSFGPPKVV